jgi:hypothetical protein
MSNFNTITKCALSNNYQGETTLLSLQPFCICTYEFIIRFLCNICITETQFAIYKKKSEFCGTKTGTLKVAGELYKMANDMKAC